jgi:hypothetical protein
VSGWIDRDDAIVRRTVPEPVWDLAERAPDLAAAAFRAIPGLAAVADGLRSRVPIPRRRAPFRDPPFVRFAGHGRSSCVALGDPSTGGHLVFKGAEPTCDDYEAWLDEQAAHRLRIEARQQTHFGSDGGVEAEMSILDKWAVLEGKVPGAYTLTEALGEASTAARLQSAFVAAYGELARAPLPLLACRWEDERTARVRAELGRRLSPAALAIAERGLERGLGLYVYHYPGPPVRLAHLPLAHAEGIGLGSRLRELGEILDWRETAEGWMDLAARMMRLGFLPKSPASLLSGDCLQFQNAVLDGGLADLDSVVHVDAVKSERELRDVLRRSLLELQKSILTLLLGAPAQQAGFLRRFPDVTACLWNELMSRLAKPGAHPRIAAALRGPDWLDRLEDALRHAFA